MTDGRGDELLNALRRWSADEHRSAAVTRRTQARWQAQAANEEMRFHGALTDAFERGHSVELLLPGDRHLAGVLHTVGRDFCAVTPDGRATTFVALSAVQAVLVLGSPRALGPASSRTISADAPALSDVLAELADTRPVLRLRLQGSEKPFAGELFAVGSDVISLAVNQPDTTTVFLALAAIVEVTVAQPR